MGVAFQRQGFPNRVEVEAMSQLHRDGPTKVVDTRAEQRGARDALDLDYRLSQIGHRRDVIT